MNEGEMQETLLSLQAWQTGMSAFAECIVWFQHIEHTLAICISVFSGMDEELGEIVVSQMSFKARVSALAALTSHRAGEGEVHDDIRELFSRVRWAEQQRNRLVHSMWELSENHPGTILREKAVIRKNQHSIDEEQFFPEDFEELQRLFEGINTDLVYLLATHYPDLSGKFHY